MNFNNYNYYKNQQSSEFKPIREALPPLSPVSKNLNIFGFNNKDDLFFDNYQKSLNNSFDISDSISMEKLATPQYNIFKDKKEEKKAIVNTIDHTPDKAKKVEKVCTENFPKLKEFKDLSFNNELDEKSSNNKAGCNCKKTKCLKLYCACFANGGVCTDSCRCENCHNKKELEDLRQLIINETVEKNPLAFKNKYKNIEKKGNKLHSRGCRCNKTGCVKNYCECFKEGIGCSRLCRCTNCLNSKIELEDEEVPIYYERVLRKRKKPNYIYDFYFNKYSNLKSKDVKKE